MLLLLRTRSHKISVCLSPIQTSPTSSSEIMVIAVDIYQSNVSFFKHLLRSHADHSHEQQHTGTSRDDHHAPHHKGEGGAAPPTCQPASHQHDHHGHDHGHDGPQGSLLCHEMIRMSSERNFFSRYFYFCMTYFMPAIFFRSAKDHFGYLHNNCIGYIFYLQEMFCHFNVGLGSA
jgi:hypothetical protein